VKGGVCTHTPAHTAERETERKRESKRARDSERKSARAREREREIKGERERENTAYIIVKDKMGDVTKEQIFKISSAMYTRRGPKDYSLSLRTNSNVSALVHLLDTL
jgi:hypothetical protein